MKRLFANAMILAWEGENFRLIRNGYLGIENDSICYIGSDRPVETYDEERDFSGKLLMPGLINCHCHAAMVLLRGVGSDLPLDRWLYEEMFPVEARLTAEQISAGNALAMMEMIASGVTSFSDMYMEPETAILLNKDIGMKMNLTRVVQSFDPNERAEDSSRISESIALFESQHNAQNGKIRIDFSIHAEYTITECIVRGYVERIRPYLSKGARMHLHLSETEKEHRECIERHRLTPAQWFDSLGVFDLPTAAAHCVWVTEEDLRVMLRKGVYPIHNPSSNLKLGSGFAPIPKMLDMGLMVALGTDGAASNNNLNMFEEMHLASIIHNGYHRNPVIMTPETVLKMATIHGARLQGRNDTGSLEVGKKADIIAVDFSDRAHMLPAFDPINMLVYSAQSSDVCMTMVDGQILYENGKYLTLDTDKVLKDARCAIQSLYGIKNGF